MKTLKPEQLGARVDADVPRYRYDRVEVLAVYHADTITVMVDLGFKISVKMKLRLARINAWEVRGEEKERGLLAKAFLKNQIYTFSEYIRIETFKDATGKYGRMLAELYVRDRNINDLLVEKGHGKYQDY